MNFIDVPRLTITALKGGAGKTILTLGLIRAWKDKRFDLTPFKKGPDYIDAGWMAYAANSPCYNLDPFFMPKSTILSSFWKRTQHTDIAIIEGNRGLYDGVDEAGSCSTAELARWLGSPIILVVDCTKVTRTAAAMVLGCLNFDPELPIKGVILNHVARNRHENIVTKTIETYTGIKVLGAIPRMKGDPLPMRHLGVTPCDEHPEAKKALDRLSKAIRESVELDLLEKIAHEARPLSLSEHSTFTLDDSPAPHFDGPIIGVIKDPAFQFYYPENLEAIEKAGAKIRFINALSEEFPRDIHGLYIGGGFPETQAQALSNNTSFRHTLLDSIERGLPVYAECGGLMYLGENIIWNDCAYPMVGAISWDFILGRRPVGHGYSVLECTSSHNPFYTKGTLIQGHEFHYSRPVPTQGPRPGILTFKVLRGHGFDGQAEGIIYKNLFGTYTHIHALDRTDWAPSLVRLASEYRISLTERIQTRPPMDQAKPDSNKLIDKKVFEPYTKIQN